MTKIFILIFFVPIFILGQTPKQQGLQEYLIPDKGDTIRFYVYNPDSVIKTKLFLYLQGSGYYPMINGDDENICCFNNYPKQLMRAFPNEYAFVYIQKMGLPFYIRNLKEYYPYNPGTKFTQRNNVNDRAEIANKVLNYLLKKVYRNIKTVAVLGHSEGSDVVASLALLNKKITHICFAAGSGHDLLYDQTQLIRRRMFMKEISVDSANKEIEKLNTGIKSVIKDPNSITKYFNGDTYKWWTFQTNEPNIYKLIRLKIPIYLVHGTHDSKVPIEGADYIISQFQLLKKTNLEYKLYNNCDHDFKEISENGKIKNRWQEIFFDFLQFVEKRNAQ